MDYYPIRIDTPLNHPLVLLKKIPNSVFKAPILFDRLFEQNKGDNAYKLFNVNDYSEYLKRQQLAPIKGFIFHPSRSGSTLTSQLLAELNHTRVISEAASINTAIKALFIDSNDPCKYQFLENLINGYSVDNDENLENIFFKFTSWLTNFLPEFCEIFPNIPWVYVYRHPIEIAVSNLKQPAFLNYMRNSGISITSFLLGESPSKLQSISIELLVCKLLSRNMKSVLNALGDGKGIIVDYKDLKSDVFKKILPHFGYAPSPSEIESILNRSNYYSKSKKKTLFQDDTIDKQKQASKSLIKAIEETKLLELISELNNFKT